MCLARILTGNRCTWTVTDLNAFCRSPPLYRALARLLESELIVEIDERPTRGDDERRRYYRITPLGAAVARAEGTRLSRLVERARSVKLFA
jgi:DNA-binding PadR family transcriptional regulator